MADEKTEHVGRVVQIIGPAVDIEFGAGHLPSINNAIRILDNGEIGKVPIDVVVEVAQHTGESRVRCIAMKPTDGMVRGMKAIDLGSSITVPVGRETLGRILNVLGEPVDGLGAVNSKERWPIHRQAAASLRTRRRGGRTRPPCRRCRNRCGRPRAPLPAQRRGRGRAECDRFAWLTFSVEWPTGTRRRPARPRN